MMTILRQGAVLVAVAAGVALVSGYSSGAVLAQGTAGSGAHSGHSMPAPSPSPQAKQAPSGQAAGNDAAVIKEFQAINEKMHKDMAIPLTGKVDVDFVKGMIPHHQGAIDMAEVVLKYSENAKIRKLARDIVKAQKSEIAMMKAWLAANEKK